MREKSWAWPGVYQLLNLRIRNGAWLARKCQNRLKCTFLLVLQIAAAAAGSGTGSNQACVGLSKAYGGLPEGGLLGDCLVQLSLDPED
jgi:hypothetical protein